MALMKELPNLEQPREKAVHFGIDSLSSRELLALLIRTGINGSSSLDTADRLLQAAGGLKGIPYMTLQEMMQVKGISKVKALEISACFEIARRCAREEVFDEDVISRPEALIKWLRLTIGHHLQEEMIAVFLDNAHHVLGTETLFKGTGDASLVSARDIFRTALQYGAAAVMLAHNHPSGNVQPSQEDLLLTQEIIEAGNLMKIKVLDHLIISQNSYISFRKEGWMFD
ncbi:MAG: DNA repair protein RadC [Solobacterium sp.]|nr:DNA repair protein RadC [Solobacterium sp.]